MFSLKIISIKFKNGKTHIDTMRIEGNENDQQSAQALFRNMRAQGEIKDTDTVQVQKEGKFLFTIQ